MRKQMHINETQIKEVIRNVVYDFLSESLRTHDKGYGLLDKLYDLEIDYDYVNSNDTVIEIYAPTKEEKERVQHFLNFYGWKNIKETPEFIIAERIYGDNMNDYDDLEAYKENEWCGEEEYPHGVGIYYHITQTSKVPKILRQGLVPKEGGKLGYKRGERVYLISFPSLELTYDIGKRIGVKDFTILKVDLRPFLGDKINIYQDEFADEGAVYTYDFIPPSCIEVFNKIEVPLKK